MEYLSLCIAFFVNRGQLQLPRATARSSGSRAVGLALTSRPAWSLRLPDVARR